MIRNFTYVFIAWLCLFVHYVTGQKIGHEALNLYPIDTVYNYYDIQYAIQKDMGGDTTEGSHAKLWRKMDMLWGRKMFPSGRSHQMGKSITQYVRHFIGEGQKNCIEHPWTELGPVGKPEKAYSSGGSGQIHAIRCSPNYKEDKTVYAASNWGGLWKRVGDNPWVMLNTDFQLPFTSVSDIAIDYQNTRILYITTGDAEMSIGHHAQNHDGAPSKMTPLFTAGVWRSWDGGNKWHDINGGPEQPLLRYFDEGGTIRKIILHPENSQILYIASSEGIFKTSNAGEKQPEWKRIFFDARDRELKGLEFKPGQPSTIYASGRDIYISKNNGRTWFTMTGSATGLDLKNMPDKFKTDRINIAVTEANPEVVYAYITGTCELAGKHIPRLYLYKFDGRKWKEILVQTDKGSFGFITPIRTPVICSPTDENNVCFGREILWGGQDIEKRAVKLTGYNSGNIHADIHALAFIPGENKLWIGSDGGVHIKDLSFQNTQGGTDISEGLGVKTIYRFDDSADADDKIIIGSQDTGTDVYKNGTWTFIDGGDGYNGKVDITSGMAYYSMNNRLMAYNWHKKQHHEHKLPQDPTTGEKAWMRGTFDMKNHPESERLIFSMTELYERLHHTPSAFDDKPDSLWEIRSDVGKYVYDLWRRQLTEFDIAPSQPDFWLIALSGTQVAETQTHQKLLVTPRLFRAKEGPCRNTNDFHSRGCFEDITQNLIQSGAILTEYGYTESDGSPLTPVITSVLFHPEDHLKAWVTFTGYEEGVKVWATNDGGDSWYNTDPKGSLQNLPVNDIVYQKGSYDRLYIATDAGVYTKAGDEEQWNKFCDFPNAIVTALKINYCNQKLRASTFGRGMWETDLLPGDGTLGTSELVIDTMTEWHVSRGIDRHIRIKKGGTLLLKGDFENIMTLSMPFMGKIILEDDASLILDNAHITHNCGLKWDGIAIPDTNDNMPVQWLNKSAITHSENGVFILDSNLTRWNIQNFFKTFLK
jgi:hypothetical protein